MWWCRSTPIRDKGLMGQLACLGRVRLWHEKRVGGFQGCLLSEVFWSLSWRRWCAGQLCLDCCSCDPSADMQQKNQTVTAMYTSVWKLPARHFVWSLTVGECSGFRHAVKGVCSLVNLYKAILKGSSTRNAFILISLKNMSMSTVFSAL